MCQSKLEMSRRVNAVKYHDSAERRPRTASTTNSMPGLKNSRKPERKQQTPPVNMPTMRAKRTPTVLSCLPMKGVTRKEVRQLVPMMKPYTDAPNPASSDILGVALLGDVVSFHGKTTYFKL